MVTRFYGIKTGVRKVSVPSIIGISKTQARINLSNIDLTYLEQTTPGTVLSDNDIVSAQNIAPDVIVPKGSIVQYTYKVFTFTPPYFPPFFPPFFPPHFPPFFPPFFPPHFPPFFPPFFPPHFPPFFPPYFPGANVCNACPQYVGTSAICGQCTSCVNMGGYFDAGGGCYV